MPKTLTMLNNLINPEVMADMISAKAKQKIAALPYAKVDDSLKGAEGDTIKIPRFEHIGDAVEVGEGEEIPMRTLSATTVEYKIKKIGLGVPLSDEAVLSAHGNIVGETNSQLGDAIAQKTDNDVVEELCKAKTTYVGGKISYEEIVRALDLFGEERNSDKIMFVHPHQMTTLRLDPNFLSADKYDNKVVTTGEFGKIANVRLVVSKKVKLVDGSYICPIVKLNEEKDSEDESPAITIYVKRDTNVEKERITRNRTTEITVDKLYITALTNESKVVLAKLDSNITPLTVTPNPVNCESTTPKTLTIKNEGEYTLVSENPEIATVDKAKKQVTGVANGDTFVVVTAKAPGKFENRKRIPVKVTGIA